MFVRARRQLVLSLRERADRAEAEQQLRVEQARQHERARIAREMHDVLAHRISLLSMHAGALEFRPDAAPEEIARAAGVVRASAHQALQDLREVIGVLREEPLDGDPERPQPTLANLPGLLDESRQAGMHVSSECRVEDLTTVPDGVGRNAYRIVQEGLTNARKHAQGATVDVMLDGAAGSGLTVEVRNRLALADAAARADPRHRQRADRPVGAHEPGGREPRARPHAGRRLRAAGVAALAVMSAPIRVLIADDDALVRGALTMMLTGTDDIRIVAEVADGSEVASAVARVPSRRRADGHPHAAHGRARRHRGAARPRRRPAGDHPHHLRRRRPRAARAAGRGERLPAQGHAADGDPQGGPARGRRARRCSRRP